MTIFQYLIYFFTALSLNIAQNALPYSSKPKTMSADADKGGLDHHVGSDGNTYSHLPHLIHRLDEEYWNQEYGTHERKKDLQGPWDCYISEHSQLRKYLAANKYNDGKTAQSDGSKKEAPSQQLFIVFGSGPEPGHEQGVAENDSEASMTYWCPDVREAMPILSKTLAQEWGLDKVPTDQKLAKAAAVAPFKYVYCAVGTRDEWKDPDNSFRLDPYIALKRIPTLFHWATGDKLEEDDCKDAGKIKAFVEKHLNKTK